ncbi:hypothetical protein [uncultured Fibrobacter sp.]|uniref:OB-fold protein n=1 Tax=uncultured Fibrobacter sp. TaxID=261512 RepID=UPI0028041E49|nr:hypothetical protein [uncultured Fibrobacter sp.]
MWNPLASLDIGDRASRCKRWRQIRKGGGKEEDKPAELTITAKNLLDEYRSNEVRAKQTYDGKRVQITGYIFKIEELFGMPSVSIIPERNFDFQTLSVLFPKKDKAILANLEKGRQITVICTLDIDPSISCEDAKVVK